MINIFLVSKSNRFIFKSNCTIRYKFSTMGAASTWRCGAKACSTFSQKIKLSPQKRLDKDNWMSKICVSRKYNSCFLWLLCKFWCLKLGLMECVKENLVFFIGMGYGSNDTISTSHWARFTRSFSNKTSKRWNSTACTTYSIYDWIDVWWRCHEISP